MNTENYEPEAAGQFRVMRVIPVDVTFGVLEAKLIDDPKKKSTLETVYISNAPKALYDECFDGMFFQLLVSRPNHGFPEIWDLNKIVGAGLISDTYWGKANA